MPLKYSLHDNQMTADPNDKMAVTVTTRQYTIDDLINKMISRGSLVTKSAALSAFEEQFLAMEELLKEGDGTLVTPMFNISFSIPGVFKDEEDGFDNSRHQVKIRITPGVRLKKLESQIKTQKVKPESPTPLPQYYYDNVSETQNEVVTSNGGFRLRGSLLKIDGTMADEGVFFINTETGAVIKAANKFLRNKPAELIMNAPELPAGSYRVEVRNRFSRTKDVRTGALPVELTVV